MRLTSPLEMLGTAFAITSLLSLCTALPAAAATPTPISMPVKFAAFRNYISNLPDTNATHNYALGADGPTFQQKYADGDCLEVRYYNRDCIRNILYKTRGVLNFLDTLGWATMTDPWPDQYNYFNTGYYEDPDDGWTFYYTPWITFGKCGNKGYVDLCSVTWCRDKEGKSGLTDPDFFVPKGGNAILDPNDRDSLCPWLKEGGQTC
jgi:hypothetical protein